MPRIGLEHEGAVLGRRDDCCVVLEVEGLGELDFEPPSPTESAPAAPSEPTSPSLSSLSDEETHPAAAGDEEDGPAAAAVPPLAARPSRGIKRWAGAGIGVEFPRIVCSVEITKRKYTYRTLLFLSRIP